MSLLYTFFGWMVRELFYFFGNYGMAIIMFTIIIRGALIPLNIRSQKSMIKMQALSGKTAELQRKYGDDKQKYQEELMKLQQENGAMGGFSGCILPFIQLIILIPIYRVISGPLIYLSQVSTDNVQAMIDLATEEGLAEGLSRLTTQYHISLIEILQSNSDFLNECISKGYIAMGQLLDLRFFGMDLTKIPAWNPVKIMSDPRTYVPLLIFPVLVIAINVLSMKLSMILKPGYKEQKEAKEREKSNPARAGQAPNDQAEASMKVMMWMMPIIMVWTTFTLPAAMGLYWVVGGLMGIITQLATYFLFTKPYELKKLEMEQKKAMAFKKNADAGDGNAKKNGKKNSKKK